MGNERDNGIARPASSMVYWPLLIDKFYRGKPFAQRNVAFAVRTDRAGLALAAEGDPAGGLVRKREPAGRRRAHARPDPRRLHGTDLIRTGHAGHRRGCRAAARRGGIYGVIAYVAQQRTKEIGIRMALGAAGRDVSGLFVRHGIVLAGIGIVCGMVAAALLTRTMSALLFGVSAFDPLTYGAVALALGGTAVLASYLPARRASRVDPAEALRWEA